MRFAVVDKLGTAYSGLLLVVATIVIGFGYPVSLSFPLFLTFAVAFLPVLTLLIWELATYRRGRTLQVYTLTLAVTFILQPHVQILLMKHVNDAANRTLLDQANDADLLGKPESEATRLFGTPHRRRSLTDVAGPDGANRVALDWFPVQWFWLGDHLHVVVEDGKIKSVSRVN